MNMNLYNSALRELLSRSKRRNVDDFPDVTPIKVAKRDPGPIFVTLAKESPARSDSEGSIYGSLHSRETDSCHDPTDTDSYSSEEVEVLEYEVASDTASEAFYSNDSSTGTDDLPATEQTEQTEETATTRAIVDTSASEMHELCFSADTDDSDETDVELGLADYWTCVKCKNRQNNPMYRYCERCYQIRKTQFPPRPKHHKKRSKPKKNSPRKRRAVTYSSDDLDSSDGSKSPAPMRKKYYSRRRTPSKTNSAGETGKSSTADDNEFDDRVKEGQSPSKLIIKNKLLKNVVDVENTSQLKSTELNLSNPPAKDSGFSSCSSSQDLSTDLAPSQSFVSASSQETFCSEYEDNNALGSRDSLIENTLHETKSFDSTVSSTITSQSSNLSQASTSSGFSSAASTSSASSSASTSSACSSASTSSGLRSLSSCSGPNSVQGLESGAPACMVRRPITGNDDGQCVVCLSQPKDGVFVHRRFLHLCCCYRCAVKIWNKKKRCPICACKVNNVLKIFVH